MPSKHQRRAARENVLALLYSCDIKEMDIIDAIENGAYPEEEFWLSQYAERIARGIAEKQSEIDTQLAVASENWALDRMPMIDRAILRLSAYEMLYVDEVPVPVAISEAVELARQYGSEDESSRFVNGVLGRIARGMDEEQLADERRGDERQAREEASEPTCVAKPDQEVKA